MRNVAGYCQMPGAWVSYQRVMSRYIRDVEDEKVDSAPPDIDLRVYSGKELSFVKNLIGV
jgi:hypothetical protein